mgnify:FL=1
MKFFFIFFAFFIKSFSVISVEPNEILSDVNLEKRAKIIGEQLRCLVCQNEDIQNSNADVAKDLRKLVRKLLNEGKTNKEIIKYVHQRYGDFVLFSPPVRFDTIALWLTPLIFIFVLVFIFFRKR